MIIIIIIISSSSNSNGSGNGENEQYLQHKMSFPEKILFRIFQQIYFTQSKQRIHFWPYFSFSIYNINTYRRKFISCHISLYYILCSILVSSIIYMLYLDEEVGSTIDGSTMRWLTTMMSIYIMAIIQLYRRVNTLNVHIKIQNIIQLL